LTRVVGCPNNVKCQVMYNRQVILTGHKDLASNLWTLPIFPKAMRSKSGQEQFPKPNLSFSQMWRHQVSKMEKFNCRM
jgi:hypothetical protein